MINIQQISNLIPSASEWVEEQEILILSKGIKLNAKQMDLATKIGIIKIEKVRLLNTDTIPLPINALLNLAIKHIGLISDSTIGITFRYGIYIRSDHWQDESLLIHELTHTMQYEKLGSITNFLNQYIKECNYYGYDKSPLEIEARAMESIINEK